MDSFDYQQPALKRLKTARMNPVPVSESSEVASETGSDDNRLLKPGAKDRTTQHGSRRGSEHKKTRAHAEKMTEKERQEERRAANRLSAFKSRQRRKNIIKDLQDAVAALMKDNAEQHWKINALKKELSSVKNENEEFRTQLAASKKKQTKITTTPTLGAPSCTNCNPVVECLALIKELAAIEEQLLAIRRGEAATWLSLSQQI